MQEDIEFTLRQARAFYALTDQLEKEGIALPKRHLQSSYGMLNYPELRGDYVRAGIALYGCLSRYGDHTVMRPDLCAVLSLKARVTLVRTVRAGESVGYGRAFTAPQDMRLAVVSARVCGWGALHAGAGRSSADTRPVCAAGRTGVYGYADGGCERNTGRAAGGYRDPDRGRAAGGTGGGHRGGRSQTSCFPAWAAGSR